MAGPMASEAPESEHMMAKPTRPPQSLRQPLSSWAVFVTKPNAGRRGCRESYKVCTCFAGNDIIGEPLSPAP